MPEAYWKRPASESEQKRHEATGRMGWTIALIAVAILILARCDNPFLDILR